MLFAASAVSAAYIHGMSPAEYPGPSGTPRLTSETVAERHCGLRSPSVQRRSAAVMSVALHLATVDDAEDFLLSSMCSHSLESVLTLDDAPKLAHSIAINLEDALAGATHVEYIPACRPRVAIRMPTSRKARLPCAAPQTSEGPAAGGAGS